MQLKPELIQQIQTIIATAKDRAIRSVDTERVLMYWQIGKVIFVEEQEGKVRAGYGEFLIRTISATLLPLFGSGFSVRQLEMCRQFYRTFPIANAVRSQFSWTHYRTLIRIENAAKRDFYIAEAEKTIGLQGNWNDRLTANYLKGCSSVMMFIPYWQLHGMKNNLQRQKKLLKTL